MSLRNEVRRHWFYVVMILIIAVLGAVGITFKPEAPDPLALLSPTHVMLLGLSLSTVIILWGISAYLFIRWIVTGRRLTSTLAWAFSYLVYGILFVAMCFQALGAPWANMNDPVIFFWFRQAMIWFLVLQWIGIAKRLTNNSYLHYVPATLMLVGGYIWFTWGLLIVGDIEYTMYGLTYGMLLPIAFTMAYSFHLYAQSRRNNAPHYLALGFVGVGICYGAWAPWHLTQFYFIWFFLFTLSLIPIAIGFLMLSRDVEIRLLREG